MRRFRYLTNCVELGMGDVAHLQSMIDGGKPVTLATVRRRCNRLDLAAFEQRMGYAIGPEQGLHLKNDWHVGYYRSTWKDQPCYFITHSAIEHIFVRTG